MKKLFSYIGEYKRALTVAPLFVAGEVAFSVLMPLVMANIVNNGINAEGGGDISYVLRMGGIMIVMALLSLTCGIFSGRFASVGAMGFAKNLRCGIFSKIQDFSFANVDKFSTASLVTRLTTDITRLQMTVMMGIRVATRSPLMLVGSIAMAFTLNSRLAVVFLALIPVMGIGIAIIAVKAVPRFTDMLKKFDDMNSEVQENLTAIRVVKAFVRGDYETGRFKDASDGVMKASVNAEKLLVFHMPLMQLAMYSCIIAICWFGGKMIIGGSMLVGDLIGFLSYIMQVLMSLMMLAMIFVGVVMSKASINRIVEVLNEEIDIKDSAEDRAVHVENGSVVFQDVSFGYGGPGGNLTLKDINFEIQPGQTIGILGGTGSSKTTLVQLIPRLYDVSGGRVLVGGRDVREYPLKTLRDSVAMVLQNNVLFSGTIRENLKWGDMEAGDGEIEAACRAASAHDFIASFPNGYDTDLGQGGVNLSGGQKQRLCIARALLKKPKVLILDDSTSAVDVETESRIARAFREDLAETTKIIIAQRISSVKDADRIIVMDDGRIDAMGTHDELLAENEIYREVYESQQKGAERDAS